MGTWPKTSWKMSGSGVYSIESRERSQVVVGNMRAASISKKASAGRKPLTGVDCQPVLRLQESADLGEIGQLVFAEADLVEAVEVLAAGVLA